MPWEIKFLLGVISEVRDLKFPKNLKVMGSILKCTYFLGALGAAEPLGGKGPLISKIHKIFGRVS